MPIAVNPISAASYTSASSLPRDVWKTWEADAANSNIVYPQALKLHLQESDTASADFGDRLWITIRSYPNSRADPTLDFVLACTRGPLGDYPVFIYSTRPLAQLTTEYVRPRMKMLVDELACRVPASRVFSIFAVQPVTESFVELWTAKTGIAVHGDSSKDWAYYAANLTFCTKQSFVAAQRPMKAGLQWATRPAEVGDIPAVAALCHSFAADSVRHSSSMLLFSHSLTDALQPPFVLTEDAAMKEAALLVGNGLVWVHIVQKPDAEPVIASICAVTRKSHTVVAITKVYTRPDYRGLGCAALIVRDVCKQ